jgi:hypothetical protein
MTTGRNGSCAPVEGESYSKAAENSDMVLSGDQNICLRKDHINH